MVGKIEERINETIIGGITFIITRSRYDAIVKAESNHSFSHDTSSHHEEYDEVK